MVVIAWLINSNSITEEIKETHGITINNDTNSLSIIGLPINNGISIGCNMVTSSPPYTETVRATFTVVYAFPVENLTIEFNDNIMTSTWSQPSCVPVNYSYHVNINNDTLIVTNTTLQYPVSSCQNYTVSITIIDTEQPQYHSDTVNKTTNYIEGNESSCKCCKSRCLFVFFISLALNMRLAGIPIVTFDTTDECNVTVPLKVIIILLAGLYSTVIINYNIIIVQSDKYTIMSNYA